MCSGGEIRNSLPSEQSSIIPDLGVADQLTCRKWYTYDFLAEPQKLLEKVPTSKDAGLTTPGEGMSNISKYPGHLPDFACYDGNPHNQGLFGVDGACINKTLYMAQEEKV
ncbi:uncharacterized protein TNCV_3912741 [Trichonephila clavipes]|nr:uncharacterized protein TNCV_3912741 [Trichonephila clavipes]